MANGADGGWHAAETRALRQSLTEAQAKMRAKHAELTQTQFRLAIAERQIAECNHRIANNLQLVIAMLRVQANVSAPGSATDHLRTAVARLEAVARLHQQHTRRPAKPTIDFGAYVTALAEDLTASLDVQCTVQADPIELENAIAADFAVAVNELVVNAAKYGRGPDGVTRVEITCCRDDQRNLCVIVRDHGPGIGTPAREHRRSSLGLALVRDIVTSHGGNIFTESDNGARVTMRVPRP